MEKYNLEEIAKVLYRNKIHLDEEKIEMAAYFFGVSAELVSISSEGDILIGNVSPENYFSLGVLQ